MFNVSDIVERNRRDTENYNYTSKISFTKYLIG